MKPTMLRLALALCLGTTSAAVLAADPPRPAYDQLAAAGSDPVTPAQSTASPAADPRPAADSRAPLDGAERPRMRRDDDNSRTVGTTIDDATITAKVKTALFTDEITKAWDINVDTMRSVVTLRGRVGSQAEADRAARIANSTEGVSSVRNELEVAR